MTTKLRKRLIEGDDLPGSDALAPFSYVEYWEAVVNMHKNTWRPQEISSGNDRVDYVCNLLQNEKEVFENQFSFLTFMDVNILKPLAWLLAITTAPEVSAWIARQIAEEENHEETYQYIAEQTGIDEVELYTKHQHIPSMMRKAELARRYTAKIRDYARTGKGIKGLIEGVFFYSQCYEGIWFMGGFAPIYALNESKKMLSTGKQLEYIWRDEAQHVDGWTRWLKLIMKETGEYLSEERAVEIMDEALEAQKEYAKECLPTIIGYSPDTDAAWSRFLANLRLDNLGYKHRYEGARPPIWIGKYQTKKEGNFFETRVTEYQVGGTLNWD